MSEDRQVNYLVDMALEEGLEPAIKLAENIGSPFVLDEFHDILIDRLWEILIEKWNLNPNI